MASQVTCTRGLVVETLSAWRDRALGQSEMSDITAHVRTCQRCQRQLTQFDIISQALQRQRAPDLHDRVWREVLAGMTTRPRGGHHVAVLGGASAMVALLVVAILVFTALHANHGTRPPLVATATTASTSTVIPLSSFTPASQAWGNFPKQSQTPTTTIGPSLSDVLSDGSGYVGEAGDGQNVPETIVKVRLPGGDVQTLHTLAHGEGLTVLTDGRFVAWGGDYLFTGAGARPYQSVGYVDMQTGAVTTLIADKQGLINDALVQAVDHGYFVWAPITAQGEDLNLTNMATGTTTRIAALGTVPETDYGLGQAVHMHLSWPYIFYTNAGQQHLYTITTGKDITLDQIKQDDFISNDFALDGTTLFWLHTSSSDAKIVQIDMIAHCDQPGASPQKLVTFANANIGKRPDGSYGFITTTGANSRLVVWNDLYGNYAWDRAQSRLVEIYAVPALSDGLQPGLGSALLHGNELAYMSLSSTAITVPPTATTVYNFFDTSKLP